MNGIPDIIRATHFAEIAHFGQTYNDEVPYTYHLDQVHAVLVRFGVRDIVLLVGSKLHDVQEDSRFSYNDIKDRFGLAVAELTYAVTNERGRNRKERNTKTYPKIAGIINATILKLADRIANMEYGMASGSKQVGMYRKEYPEFRDALRIDYDLDVQLPDHEQLVVMNMWAHLDVLMLYARLLVDSPVGTNNAGEHRISDLQKIRRGGTLY